MGIKFNGSEISSIKYCNASGVLQDVTGVVQNGATIWEKPSAASSATFYLEGVPANTTLLGTTGKVVSTSAPVTVDWGDGNTDTIAYSSDMRIPAHTYVSAGNYQIVIRGKTLTGVSAVSSSNCPILAETNGTGLSYLTYAEFVGITSIGDYSFYSCSNLNTADTSHSSVTSLGDSCFYFCTSLSGAPITNSLTSLGSSCFYGCSHLDIVTIPDSVTSLGNYCFRLCTGLMRVTLPDNGMSLGEGCFYGCSSLTDVTIPDRMGSLGPWCFCECTGLWNVTLGAYLAGIGENCFYLCSSLARMSCKSTMPPTLRSSAFSYVPKSIPVYVPSASISMYQASEGWSDFTNFQPISE